MLRKYLRKRRPTTKRRYARKSRRVGKKKVASRTHLFRRLGQPMRLYQSGQNTWAIGGYDGTGSLQVGALGSDGLTNTVQLGASFQFKLESVQTPSDFTTLFDRYKILGVKLKFMYQCDSASVGGLNIMPIINYCYDNDDASVPSSSATVIQKGACKTRVLTANREFSVYIKPKVANAIYQTGVSSVIPAYSSSNAPWINCDYMSAPHYGLKMWINNLYSPLGANNQITIQPVYYLALKDSQ